MVGPFDVFLSGDDSGAVAVYSGRASDFPVGSPLSQTQPLDAFVFTGPGHPPSANLTETLIPGRLPYQLSDRQDYHIHLEHPPAAMVFEQSLEKNIIMFFLYRIF